MICVKGFVSAAVCVDIPLFVTCEDKPKDVCKANILKLFRLISCLYQCIENIRLEKHTVLCFLANVYENPRVGWGRALRVSHVVS